MWASSRGSGVILLFGQWSRQKRSCLIFLIRLFSLKWGPLEYHLLWAYLTWLSLRVGLPSLTYAFFGNWCDLTCWTCSLTNLNYSRNIKLSGYSQIESSLTLLNAEFKSTRIGGWVAPTICRGWSHKSPMVWKTRPRVWAGAGTDEPPKVGGVSPSRRILQM